MLSTFRRSRKATRTAMRRLGLVAAAFASGLLYAETLPSPSKVFAQEFDSVQLSGRWSFDISQNGVVENAQPMVQAGQNLGQVTVTQKGDKVEATWTEPAVRMIEEYGYTPGDMAFEGQVRDGTLVGRIRLRYPAKNRAACPENWQTWKQLEVALPDNPQVVQGRFRNSAISPRDCSITDSGWLFFILTRETDGLPEDNPGLTSASGILAESDFDSDSEGWALNTSLSDRLSVEDAFKIDEFVDDREALAADQVDGISPVQHLSAGGNPGGYIGGRTDPRVATVWEAPIQFLGDQSHAINGELLLDLNLSGQLERHQFTVQLIGANSTVQRVQVAESNAGWHTYSIRLNAMNDWQKTETQQPASDDDLHRALSSLQAMRFVTSGGSGLDNVVLRATGSPEGMEESAADTQPARVRIDLIDRSAVVGKAINLRVALVNESNQLAIAKKDYVVYLTATGAVVRPEYVEITTGSADAGARAYGEEPGEFSIQGVDTEAELASDTATGVQCARDQITGIVFNATAQEVPVGEPILVTLELINSNHTATTDDGQRKRLNVIIEGVGHSADSNLGSIDKDRCTTEITLVSDRPGLSPVTVSLGTLEPQKRTFRFYLTLDAWVILAVILGGLFGGFVRAVSIWKRAQRWKTRRWAIETAASVISGLAVFLVYHFGVIPTLPRLSGGLGLVVLLSLVGGYLGPTALDRIADHLLPAGKSKSADG